jgi:GH15 family glucan-1,4-alpha-glucosidase
MNEARLLPEQMDTKTGRYLGNYPQAYSHIGLIMSAYYINRYTEKLKKQKKHS